MKVLRQVFVWGLVLTVSITAFALSSKEKRLVHALQNDSSFKVRLQALRILAKRVRKPVAEQQRLQFVDILGSVAHRDQHHMVRGMACFVLGQIAAPESEKYLSLALKDEQAFVRVQAETALARIVKRKNSTGAPGLLGPQVVRTSTGARALVFAVEAMPGAKIPKAMIDEMGNRMRLNLKQAALTSFRFYSEYGDDDENASTARPNTNGYKIRSSIAERSLVRGLGRQVRIDIVVRVTITTWPGNSLRHVISAKASGTVPRADPQEIKRVETQVLAGAVDQAVNDIMAQISRS